MLTLKSPVQLNSIQSFTIQSDQLAEKLKGNYQMMSISVSPQDLLHITTLPPEVCMNMESENIFVTENQIQQNYEQKYEIMNQLLNRILLYQTPQFTYQDEVFVTTVLQKMGITNVAEFMEQVKQNQIQNKQTVHLLRQYYENKDIIQKITQTFTEEERTKELLVSQEIADLTDENYFSNEIYYRLQTAENSNTIYDYRMQLHREESFQRDDLSVIWQSWQADQIQLSQLKQLLFAEWKEPVIWRENRYEQKVITPEQVTEKNVLTQLAAGMLIALAQELSFYQVQKEEYKKYHWQDFSRALYNSTQDVIERFEEYHSDTAVREEQIYDVFVSMNDLRQHEIVLLESISNEIEEGDQEMVYQQFQKECCLTLLQNQNLQQQFSENKRILASTPDLYSIQTGNYDDADIRSKELIKRGQLLIQLRNELKSELSQTLNQYQEQIDSWNVMEEYLDNTWEQELQWISINREQYFTEREDFLAYITNVIEKADHLKKKLMKLDRIESRKKEIKGIVHLGQLVKEQLQNVLMIKRPSVHMTREEYHGYIRQLETETDLVKEKMVFLQQYLEKESQAESDSTEAEWRNIADTTVKELQAVTQVQRDDGKQESCILILHPQYFVTEESYKLYVSQVRQELGRLQTNIVRQLQTKEEKIAPQREMIAEVVEKVNNEYLYVKLNKIENVKDENIVSNYFQQIDEQIQNLIRYFEEYPVIHQVIKNQGMLSADRRVNQNVAVQTARGDVKVSDIVVGENDQQIFLEMAKQQEIKPVKMAFAPSHFETEEEYFDYIREMNEKNVRIHEKILAEWENITEQKQQINLDRKTSRELALRALSDPQAALQEVYEKGEGIADPNKAEIEKLLQYTDEETRQFYLNIINETKHQKIHEQVWNDSSDTVDFVQKITENIETESELAEQNYRILQNMQSEEISELEKSYEKTLMLYHQQSDFSKEYEELLQKSERESFYRNVPQMIDEQQVLKEQREQKRKDSIRKITENIETESELVEQNYRILQNMQSEEISKLNMVHHQTLQMDELVMDEVRSSLQNELRQTRNQIEHVHTEQIIEKKVIESKQDILNTTQQNISQMIQQNLGTQVQSISDQVYRNIEHRLNSERKRRGY